MWWWCCCRTKSAIRKAKKRAVSVGSKAVDSVSDGSGGACGYRSQSLRKLGKRRQSLLLSTAEAGQIAAAVAMEAEDGAAVDRSDPADTEVAAAVRPQPTARAELTPGERRFAQVRQSVSIWAAAIFVGMPIPSPSNLVYSIYSNHQILIEKYGTQAGAWRQMAKDEINVTQVAASKIRRLVVRYQRE
jgi:hypothetical protein